jgi:hypothetical protein
MTGTVTRPTSVKGFYDLRELPQLTYQNVVRLDGTVGDVTVRFQGHHVIPQQFLNDPFFAALEDFGFDGRSYAQNGATLAYDKQGAAIVGGSTHRGPHKAYSEWVSRYFEADTAFFESASFASMTESQKAEWLKARRAD